MKRSPGRFAVTATTCEVCDRPLRLRPLGRGDVLHECPDCGHLERRLEDCPARHRDRAYGGDPTLDVIRLWLCFRLLSRGGPPRRVFEIGFGSGALLRRFLAHGSAVSGVDPEQLGVSVDPEVASRGRLRRGSVEELDVDAHEVDLVYGIHVIEHVADVRRTLRVAHDLLAPGGRLALLTPAGDSAGLRWFGASWWLLEDPTHVRFFSLGSMRRACEEAGFVDVRVRRLCLDNLTMEAASLARALRLGDRAPGGVLSSRWVMAVAMLSTPFVVAVRAVVPNLRPTMYVEARRPAA